MASLVQSGEEVLKNGLSLIFLTDNSIVLMISGTPAEIWRKLTKPENIGNVLTNYYKLGGEIRFKVKLIKQGKLNDKSGFKKQERNETKTNRTTILKTDEVMSFDKDKEVEQHINGLEKQARKS